MRCELPNDHAGTLMLMWMREVKLKDGEIDVEKIATFEMKNGVVVQNDNEPDFNGSIVAFEVGHANIYEHKIGLKKVTIYDTGDYWCEASFSGKKITTSPKRLKIIRELYCILW